jgi:sigma-E factor negative regulatory protein RseB
VTDRVMGAFAALILGASLWWLPACAEAQADSMAFKWLQKVQEGTQKLSYTGSFVYQHGLQMEMSRITRFVASNGAYEKLEAMDGGMRELIRSPEQVAYYLPASHIVKIERQFVPYTFPAILPPQLRDLRESYSVSLGEVERVAGYDCQSVVLEPKDQLRYGRKLWADVNTGMLLKARTFDAKHEPVETFAFTQLQIGNVDRERTKSSFAERAQDWRVEDSAIKVAKVADTGWLVRALPPGFRKIGEMRRTIGTVAGVGQIVYSDGLAAISVFIEPLSGRHPAAAGQVRQGAINVFSRRVGENWITVVGETPPEGVRLIANSIEYRKS